MSDENRLQEIVVVVAPPRSGKTHATITNYAEGENRKILYITRTYSIVEHAFKIFSKNFPDKYAVIVAGKNRLCTHMEFLPTCSSCPVSPHKKEEEEYEFEENISKKYFSIARQCLEDIRHLDLKTILQIAEKEDVCPFYLALFSLAYTDAAFTVVDLLELVFGFISRYKKEMQKEFLLIIDEDVTLEYFRPKSIDIMTFYHKFQPNIKSFKFHALLNEIDLIAKECKRIISDTENKKRAEEFKKKYGKLIDFILRVRDVLYKHRNDFLLASFSTEEIERMKRVSPVGITYLSTVEYIRILNERCEKITNRLLYDVVLDYYDEFENMFELLKELAEEMPFKQFRRTLLETIPSLLLFSGLRILRSDKNLWTLYMVTEEERVIKADILLKFDKLIIIGDKRSVIFVKDLIETYGLKDIKVEYKYADREKGLVECPLKEDGMPDFDSMRFVYDSLFAIFAIDREVAIAILREIERQHRLGKATPFLVGVASYKIVEIVKKYLRSAHVITSSINRELLEFDEKETHTLYHLGIPLIYTFNSIISRGVDLPQFDINVIYSPFYNTPYESLKIRLINRLAFSIRESINKRWYNIMDAKAKKKISDEEFNRRMEEFEKWKSEKEKELDNLYKIKREYVERRRAKVWMEITHNALRIAPVGDLFADTPKFIFVPYNVKLHYVDLSKVVRINTHTALGLVRMLADWQDLKVRLLRSGKPANVITKELKCFLLLYRMNPLFIRRVEAFMNKYTRAFDTVMKDTATFIEFIGSKYVKEKYAERIIRKEDLYNLFNIKRKLKDEEKDKLVIWFRFTEIKEMIGSHPVAAYGVIAALKGAGVMFDLLGVEDDNARVLYLEMEKVDYLARELKKLHYGGFSCGKINASMDVLEAYDTCLSCNQYGSCKDRISVERKAMECVIWGDLVKIEDETWFNGKDEKEVEVEFGKRRKLVYKVKLNEYSILHPRIVRKLQEENVAIIKLLDRESLERIYEDIRTYAATWIEKYELLEKLKPYSLRYGVGIDVILQALEKAGYIKKDVKFRHGRIEVKYMVPREEELNRIRLSYLVRT